MSICIEKISKGDLHLHLNGCMNYDFIFTLNNKLNVFSDDDLKKIKLSFNKEEFGSLEEYIEIWKYLRRVPESLDGLEEIIDYAFLQLKHSNVEFVEVRNSVLYLSDLLDLSDKDVFNNLISFFNKSSKKYDIKFGFIFTISRSKKSSSDLIRISNLLTENLISDGVVGLDIAGNEDLLLPSDFHNTYQDFKKKFNLPLTFHAGETGKIDNIKEAVFKYKANRIGHGTCLLRITAQICHQM